MRASSNKRHDQAPASSVLYANRYIVAAPHSSDNNCSEARRNTHEDCVRVLSWYAC